MTFHLKFSITFDIQAYFYSFDVDEVNANQLEAIKMGHTQSMAYVCMSHRLIKVCKI